MKDKRVVGYFVAGLLTAAALCGIYVWIKGPVHFGPHWKTLTGDDDPIIVAGGSLDIRSKVGFARDSSKPAHHLDNNRRMIGVLIVHKGGLDYQAVTEPTTVDFAYCQNACGSSDDTITFTANPGELLVSNARGTIGDEAGGNSHFSHQPPNWTLNQITVASKPYFCGKKGDPCLAIMVYHKP